MPRCWGNRNNHNYCVAGWNRTILINSSLEEYELTFALVIDELVFFDKELSYTQYIKYEHFKSVPAALLQKLWGKIH